MESKVLSKKKPREKIDVGIKLPKDYPWKVLGWIADDLSKYIKEDDYQLIKMVVRNKDFHAYQCLQDAWGLQRTIPESMNILEFKCLYLLASLLKKFQFEGDKVLRQMKAVEKFLAAENDCKTYNESGFLDLVAPKEEGIAVLFTYAREFLRKLLGDKLPSFRALTEWSRHGPGANLDTCEGLVSNYHKFGNWPYSCTVDAYRYARFIIESDQRWIGALQDDYRERYNIPKHHIIDMKLFWSRVLTLVNGNRITFVPKDAHTERSIAIEPSLNLYLQLGVDGFIRRRLKRYDVNLDDQTKNQLLSRRGSMDDGYRSFVTIDLKSASDSISKKLIELLLPHEWYSYLCDIGSPKGKLECLGGVEICYQKISSMGNGYTFALESAIFAAAIFAVQKYLLGSYKPKDCAIFGDDLIIEKWIAIPVIKALNLFGFNINPEKSFCNGPIRESCGTDWYQGTPIRPVFFSKTPTNCMELFTDINRLNRLLSLRCGLEESKTISSMMRWIPETLRCYEGPYSDEDFDSYRHVSTPPKAVRYNNCLYKYRRLIVKPGSLKVRNFLFRKLMHNLRPLSSIPTWVSKKTGAGSRFTVGRRNFCSVGSTYSVTDYWSSTYKD